MAYNTGNPSGSSDPRDLSDSSADIDTWATSTTADTHPDRLGVQRKTWHGMENEFDADQVARASEYAADKVYRDTTYDDAQADRAQRFDLFLANSGYQFVGDYAAGIELTEYNQVVRDTSGNLWRVSASTALPYTTTGAGLPEGNAFIAIGDADLAQNLISDPSTGQGALLVRGATIYVDSIADLLALPTSELVDGQQVSVTEYHAGTGVGGGEFYWDAARSKADHNGGTVFDPSVPFTISPITDFWAGVGGSAGTGVWVRPSSAKFAEVDWWGPLRDGTFDDVLAFYEAKKTSNNIVLGYGDYYAKSTYITGPQATVTGQGGKYRNSNTRIIADASVFTDDQPVLQITDGTTTLQNVNFRGFKLEGSVARTDWLNQDDTDTSGPSGIDVANCKETVSIDDVSFKYIKRGVFQRDSAGGYLGSLNIRDCQWAACVIGLYARPTVPVSMMNSKMDNGMIDWIDCSRISIYGCAFNNQVVSNLGHKCSILGTHIGVYGTWFEGGAEQIRLTGDGSNLVADNVHFGTASTLNSSGSSRYHISPAPNSAVIINGGFTPSTGRVITDEGTLGFSDFSGMSVSIIGTEIGITSGPLQRMHENKIGYFNYQPGNNNFAGMEIESRQSLTAGITTGKTFKNITSFGSASLGFQNQSARISEIGNVQITNLFTFSYVEIALTGSDVAAGAGSNLYFGKYILGRSDNGSVIIKFLSGDDLWNISLVSSGSSSAVISIAGNHNGSDLEDQVSFPAGHTRQNEPNVGKIITVETNYVA